VLLPGAETARPADVEACSVFSSALYARSERVPIHSNERMETRDEGRAARGHLRTVWAGILAASVAAGSRATLIALKDGYLGEGLLAIGARSFARDFLRGLALALLPALALAALAHLPRSRWLRLASMALAFAAATLFVSLRIPPMGWYAPDFARPIGKAALAVAFLEAALSVLALRLPFRRPATWAARAALGLTAVALAVSLAERSVRAVKPNVLLISLDTVRRDFLGCYGYPRPTTPSIDRFAGQSIRFLNAYSPDCWTLTAHGSLLTGLYPPAHGLDHGLALRPGVRTLAQHFAEEGYVTLGIVDGVEWFNPRYELDHGFQHYLQIPDRADWKVDALIDALADVGSEPFFAFAHLYDAHSDWRRLPYESRAEDRQSFAGWYRGDFDGCNARGSCATNYLLTLRARKEQPDAELHAYLVSLYAAGLRSLDRELGRLFEWLDRTRLDRSTIVLLTADHGEEFFEHGQPMHHQRYEEVLSVPMLLRVPGRPAADVDTVVSLVDVTPTLLELAQLDDASVDGRSLVPVLDGGSLERAYVLFGSPAGFHGLRTERWSLVEGENGPELYDVLADRAQTRDVAAAAGPPVLDALQHELRLEQDSAAELLRSGAHGAAVVTDAEARARLEALGYVGN